jgi:hypothetical protein
VDFCLTPKQRKCFAGKILINQMKKFFCSAFLTVTIVNRIFACDLCSVYSATQAHGEIGKGFFMGASEQFSHFGTLQFEGKAIPNSAHQGMDSSISQVFLGYNFHERFGVQFNLPTIYRSFQRLDHSGTLEKGSEFGFGDAALLGHFLAVNYETKQSTFRLHLLGGIKFPTGSTSRLAEELSSHGGGHHDEDEGEEEADPTSGLAGGIHGHDLSLGSGSWDGIAGLSVFGRWQKFYLAAGAQYSIRTAGDFGYRYADDATWNGGPGAFILLNDKYTLALQLNVSGEAKGRDVFLGAKENDTGLKAVYLGPQISASWHENVSADLGVDIPVSLANTGLQSVPDYRLRASFTWRF